MKNIFKFVLIGIALLSCIVIFGIIALIIKAKTDAAKPIIDNNYQQLTNVGGDIEANYLQNGSHEVLSFDERADGTLIKYTVFYPQDLPKTNQTFPAIVYCNGSGVKGSDCIAMFKHWATWGFIVIANEETSSWSGECAEKSLTFLLSENSNPNSVLFERVDCENIGVTGHS